MLSTESSLVEAVGWLRAALLGSTGTAVAVLAVGTLGLLMFNGRLPARRGATVLIGCFILFSAATIANDLIGAASMTAEPVVSPVTPQAAYAPSVPKPVPYDPYAGASVPVQREQPIIR